MSGNDKINAVGTNIAEKAQVIWNVADMLRGPFKPHEYGLVILPMTVVKRFHDCLLPTHDKVMQEYEKVKNFAVIDGFLTKASGYQFYNTSKFTFDLLLADPENIEDNFRDYLNGFSANVQDVLAKFDFDNIIKRMVESNTLYLIIKEFNSDNLLYCSGFINMLSVFLYIIHIRSHIFASAIIIPQISVNICRSTFNYLFTNDKTFFIIRIMFHLLNKQFTRQETFPWIIASYIKIIVIKKMYCNFILC